MPNFPIVPVRGVGTAGINYDTPSILLSTQTWSDGRNVRFSDEAVSKIPGQQKSFQAKIKDGTPLSGLNHVVWWPGTTQQFYVYASSTHVYRMNEAGDVANINPKDTNAVIIPYSSSGKWQSTLINGGDTLVMNNGIDAPQYISSNTTVLAPLPGWPAQRGNPLTTTTAGVIRANNNYMVAGNITQPSIDGTTVQHQPGTVAISNASAPGGVPNEWFLGIDATPIAPYKNTFQLSNTSKIVEIVALNGKVMVFTQNSIHLITPNKIPGGETGASTLNTGYGCLATDCATEINGKVFVVDKNDIYITGGYGGTNSVCDETVKTYFFSGLDAVNYENTYVVKNILHDEIWVCYPRRTVAGVEQVTCNEALIYNYTHKTWSVRDLPNTLSATVGPNIVTDKFQSGSDFVMMDGLAQGETDPTYILQMDTGFSFDGDKYYSYVERKTMDMGEINANKWTGSIYPMMEGDDTIEILMRGTNAPGASVDLLTDRKTSKSTFDIQNDYKVDPNTQGRFANIRFGSTSDKSWTLAGYSLSVDNTYTR